MIIVTAPIALIQVGQPLHALAFKALSLGSHPYVHSETHVAYPVQTAHSSMLSREAILGLVAAGGDIENLTLFIKITPTATHHVDVVEGNNVNVTWADFAASINHIPTEIDEAFYMEATDGQASLKASEVIASGLVWLTTSEFRELNA